eukprot:6211756-Pleurochrysis_carterae.AAC.1
MRLNVQVHDATSTRNASDAPIVVTLVAMCAGPLSLSRSHTELITYAKTHSAPAHFYTAPIYEHRYVQCESTTPYYNLQLAHCLRDIETPTCTGGENKGRVKCVVGSM